MREGIEEGVGGGVIGLTWASNDAGEGGEEDEGGEVRMLGERVQVPSSTELRSKDAVDAFRGHGVKEAIVEGPRGVDDGGEGMSGRDRVQEPLKGEWIGDVAGVDGDGSA
jgi:hypothetical protein